MLVLRKEFLDHEIDDYSYVIEEQCEHKRQEIV